MVLSYAQVIFFQQFYDVAGHHGFVFKPTTVKIGNVARTKKDLTHSSQYHLVNIPQNENYILSLTANKTANASQKINNQVSFKSSSLHVGQITNCISLLQEQKMCESMDSFMK
jgi:hypothetical protein